MPPEFQWPYEDGAFWRKPAADVSQNCQLFRMLMGG